jgi:hypothetical protein
MTADIINLRRIRKQRAREEQAARANEARLKAGRSKAERYTSEATADLNRRRLDAHRREPGGEGTGETP